MLQRISKTRHTRYTIYETNGNSEVVSDFASDIGAKFEIQVEHASEVQRDFYKARYNSGSD